MASISGISNTSTSSINPNALTGLVSGLDVDGMIEQMTSALKKKISDQKQQKQLLAWKQDIYRSISDPMVDFSNKYCSYASSTNLLSSSFFDKNLITALGQNSSAVSLSGSGANSGNFSISGIKQLAENAHLITTKPISSQTVQTSEFDLNGNVDISALAGKNFQVAFGKNSSGTDRVFSFSFDSTKFESVEDVAKELNRQINEQSGISTNHFKFEATTDGKLSIKRGDIGTTNTLKILKPEGVSQFTSALSDLGLSADTTVATGTNSVYTGSSAVTLTQSVETKKVLSDKTINISYNGVSKQIKLPSEDSDAFSSEAKFKEYMQNQLDQSFGKNRVLVKSDTGTDATDGKFKLSFETEDASSSIFKITGMGAHVGTVLGITSGDSNRLNLSAKLKDSSLKSSLSGLTKNDKGEYNLIINGKKIEGITDDSTINDVIKKINESDANVKVSYLEVSDKFSIISTRNGKAGEINIEGDFGDVLFNNAAERNFTSGKDSVVTLNYDGTLMDITRDSNSFSLEGMNITLNKTFGYDQNGVKIPETEEIKLTSSCDNDKITTAVKDMINEYNKIIETVNKELSTKRNRDYMPLTDEQRKEMSESEIKAWEEKTKEGLLFNNNDLRSIANELRNIFVGTKSLGELKEMGITVSTNYADNGKLSFDENKFKTALDKDSEKVKDFFTKPCEEKFDSNGNAIINNSTGGIMSKFKYTIDKYAGVSGATKGILVQIAGSKSAPSSLFKNLLLDKMNTIDNTIEKLNVKMKAQIKSYTAKFSQLEQIISKANVQSSYLSQFTG